MMNAPISTGNGVTGAAGAAVGGSGGARGGDRRRVGGEEAPDVDVAVLGTFDLEVRLRDRDRLGGGAARIREVDAVDRNLRDLHGAGRARGLSELEILDPALALRDRHRQLAIGGERDARMTLAVEHADDAAGNRDIRLIRIASSRRSMRPSFRRVTRRSTPSIVSESSAMRRASGWASLIATTTRPTLTTDSPGASFAELILWIARPSIRASPPIATRGVGS